VDNSLERWDQELLCKINSMHHPYVDTVMWQLSEIFIVLPLAFYLVYCYYRRYQMRNTIALLICAGISIAFTDLSSYAVKHVVKRYRPTHHEVIGPKLHLLKESNGQDYRGGKYGFFSSHAANTMGVTTILFLACSWINRKWRYLFYLIPLAIIYSRMYCGAHYPLDVLFGTIDGLFFGYVTFIIFRRYFFKSPLADV
jgi:undecaprenyl-diphosphatase